jgi:hypothetical protein
MVHNNGMLIYPKAKGIKYLDKHHIAYHIEKESYAEIGDKVLWAFFKIDDPLTDWEEIYDKIRFKWIWDLSSRLPLFLASEWYPMLDLGEDLYETPIEARIIQTLVDKFGREITQAFIDAYLVKINEHVRKDKDQIAKEEDFADSIAFLKKYIGKFVYVNN